MSQTYHRTCPQCGASLLANQRFCSNCGATVEVVPGVLQNFDPNGQVFSPAPPPISIANAQAPQSPQFQANQQVPSVPGTPSLPQQPPAHSLPGQLAQPTPFHGAPAQSQPILPQQVPHHAYPGQPTPFQGTPVHSQPALPQQAHLPSVDGAQVHAPGTVGSHAQPGSLVSQAAQPASLQHVSSPPPHAQPSSFHAPSAPPPHVQPSPAPGQHPFPAAPPVHAAGSVAKRTARVGMGLLLKKPLVAALAVVVLVGSGAGIAYYMYRASAPTSFVIATDRGNNQIDRIDLTTRNVTVLLSNKVLPDTPDSIVFISTTKMLIDFLNTGAIGIGDIQQGTYQSLGTGFGGALRDMALRPDGSGVLISDANGNILEFHLNTEKITTFVQNISGVQGLAFDSNGALYAAVGGQVILLDPASGKQLKTFPLPGGSDGMAYDGHHHTLDIAIGSSIVALDPQTGKTATLIDGIATPDGLAIDRQGNLFIADSIGVLELTTQNQLLIVGTDTNGITWDDVSPLSGAGAASY